MSDTVQVTEAQRAAVEKLTRMIIRFEMTIPAIMALESMRPVTFIGSQFMHVMSPAATALVPFAEWDELAHLLESRHGVEYLITQIEDAAAAKRRTESPTTEESAP